MNGGRGKSLEAQTESALAAVTAAWFRNEPKMQGKIRVAGGTPDYTALVGGVAHLIECKSGSKTSLPLGYLTTPESGSVGAGITPAQAAMLDRWEAAGGRGWIVASLPGPVILGVAAPPHVALIPWQEWRGWLAAGLRSVRPEVLAGRGELVSQMRAAWGQ